MRGPIVISLLRPTVISLLRHTVISNGAGPLFLPHSLPANGSACIERNLSSIEHPPQTANCYSARRSFLFIPWFMHRHSPSPHCHSTIPSATISRGGPHLPRLLNGQQIRRPLRRRNQQPGQTNRPTQKPTSPRLHAKIQRNETGVVRTPRRRAFRNLTRKGNQSLAPAQKGSADRIIKSPVERSRLATLTRRPLLHRPPHLTNLE